MQHSWVLRTLLCIYFSFVFFGVHGLTTFQRRNRQVGKRGEDLYGISGTALSWFSTYPTNRTVSRRWWPHLTSLKPFLCSAIGFCVRRNSLHPLHKTSFWLDSASLIESQSFAYDTRLQVSVPPLNIQTAISSLETCLSDIQTLMLENKLKSSNDKTEALLLWSSSKSFSVSKPTIISDCGCEIPFSCSARNLGFYIRDDMSVELHIKNICWSTHSELRHISTIRHLLSVDSARLDYCNSLLSGWPKHLEKLQKVQNSAARLVLKAHKRDRVSPLLRTLHWLPIQACIEYKL